MPNSGTPALGASTRSFGFNRHGRTVSYDELQERGLGKAIDEYHKLLGTGKKCAADAKSSSGPSTLGNLLKHTVVRPVPPVFTPETLLSVVSALWTLLSWLLCTVAPLAIPLAVWMALAPASTVFPPAWAVECLPALAPYQLSAPSDWKIRAAAIGALFVCLRIAEAAVIARKQRRIDAAACAVAPEALEAWYEGRIAIAKTGAAPSAAPEPAALDHGSPEDWGQLVAEVETLSKQYEDRSGGFTSGEAAVAWLQHVGSEVGIVVPEGAKYDVGVARGALERVRQSLVA